MTNEGRAVYFSGEVTRLKMALMAVIMEKQPPPDVSRKAIEEMLIEFEQMMDGPHRRGGGTE